MTSVDSGVETSNDSNDSSIVQQEAQNASFVNESNNIATITTADNSQENQHPGQGAFSINFVPSWSANMNFPVFSSLYPISDTPDLNENNADLPTASISNLTASTSNISSTYSANVMQFRVPQAYNATSTSRSNIELTKRPSTNKARIRRRNMPWKSPHTERKMRLAAATNNTFLIEKLLQMGVTPNNNDEHGRTPLHHACCRGYTDVARLLLQHGADPNRRDCIGNTPLHLAAVTSRIAIVTLLLTAGTDILSSDHHGYNPLQLAQTKLKLLRNNTNSDMMKIKEEMRNIVDMLLAYFQKHSKSQQQVETLSNFCSRLSLSNTSDQIQDDVKDLLENVNALRISS